MTFMDLHRIKIFLALLCVSSLLFASPALALNITVPSAPAAGYFLNSTSTGAYIAVTSSTVRSLLGLGSAALFASTDFLSSSTPYISSAVQSVTSTPQIIPSATSGLNIGFSFASNNISQFVNNSGYTTTTIQSVLNSISGASPITFNTSTGSIGFSDPGYLLNTNNLSELTNTSTSRINLGFNGTAGHLYQGASSVGIGDTTPSFTLDVNGNARVVQSFYSGFLYLYDGTSPTVTSTYLWADANGKVVGTSTPTGGSAAWWTAIAGTPTRTGNTTFTVTGDYTALLTTGLVIKWTESSTVRVGEIVSSSYSAPNTTVTIVGDTMASIDASSAKYASSIATQIRFSIAGTMGSTGTDIANAWYADKAYRVLSAKPSVGTAGTTNNTTFDINKGGTTMFTTKPTIATTATTGTLFTADSGTSLAINDRVSIDIDAVQTTAAIDGYIELHLVPSVYLQFN